MKAGVVRAGQLRDRVRIERYVAGTWALVAVVSASVLPGPPPFLPPADDPESARALRGNAYDLTIRYRTDLTRGMRIRRGSDTLVVQLIKDPDGRRHWTSVVCESWLGYAARHATLLADVARLGAAITFSKPDTTNYDSGTDTVPGPPVPTTWTGVAKEEAPSSEKYQANTTEQTATTTLVYVPDVYGEMPESGATATWAGKTAVIESAERISPDGVPIGARITVSLSAL